MGSTGSGRSNSIDKSAEPEGAKAPTPAIQAPHTMADWLGEVDVFVVSSFFPDNGLLL
ncbi:hypothetical protein EDD15DRAFT_2364457 [Pisolithus albus]|nr:hypothetical protein EDD15DRAFT_2364457 [Pisolithus albus]